MPVALAGFDMDDVADGDLAPFGLGRGKTFARGDNENLIAIMDMPAGGAADAEVNHVAAKIIRLAVANHRLARSAHFATAPALDGRRRVHGGLFQFVDFEHAHSDSPFVTRHHYTASAEQVKRGESWVVFVARARARQKRRSLV